MKCELCEEPTGYGFYVCLRVRGAWRWYRLCEACYAVYLRDGEDDD